MKKTHWMTLLLFIIQLTFAQTKTVKGVVSSKTDGLPIPGVSVIVKGTSTSTVTDIEGKFSIKADKNNLLNFSYVGFSAISLKVPENGILNVSLSEENNTLNEVVVIGSTVRVTRKEMGNAVTTLKSEGLIKAQPTALTSALQGKIAGAQISQNSGDPSGGFSIKLRGTSSLIGSSDPLYVIDGVVMNNATTNVTNLNVAEAGKTSLQTGQNRSSDINPNDVESIEVLNGGAAAAIYGSRAANGVVLITTKKGKAGKTEYNFSTTTSVNTLRKKVYVNLLDKQFIDNNGSLFPIADQKKNPTDANHVFVNGRSLNTQTFDVQRYDYQDDIFTTGIGTDTYFSMRGGNDKDKFFASIGYLDNEGIIKNTDFKRIGTKLRLHHEFNKKFSGAFGLNFITSSSNEKPDGSVFWSPINSVNITNNIYDIHKRDANGKLMAVDPNRVNPLSVIETFKIKQQTDRILADGQFNYKPFKGFNADIIFGLDTYNQKGTVFIPRYPYPVNTAYYNTGYVSEANNRVIQFNNDLNLRYVWDINKNFKSTTYGGYNYQMYRNEFSSIQGQDLKSLIETINAYNTPLPNSPGAAQPKYNLFGYYLQETFGFKNRLFFTVAGRFDSSTIFASNNNAQFYPKLSTSYVLSQEQFMKSVENTISSVRLRASWGESGSLTAIAPYAKDTNYAPSTLLGTTAFALDGLKQGNENLKPERSSTYEIGADLGFFKDRINLTFTYYNADIRDLLLPRQLAASEGATNTIANVGKMNNKGVEIGFRYEIIKEKNYDIDALFNFSRNRNIVTDLPLQRLQLDNNRAGVPVYAEIGQPIGIYYGSYYARNPDGSLLLNNGYPQTERGDASTGTAQRDENGQPTGSILNKKIGDPNPDYILSFGFNARYKKASLSVLFDGVQGVDVWDGDYRTRQAVGTGDLVTKELKGELKRGYIWSVYAIDEFRVVDGSYIKLREVAFNYDFGKINNFFNNFTITASGRNLYSWDKFTSYDPETNSGGQSSVAKYNFGTVPIPRTFSLALKFQF